MKKYFDFNLAGSKLFLLQLVFFAVLAVPLFMFVGMLESMNLSAYAGADFDPMILFSFIQNLGLSLLLFVLFLVVASIAYEFFWAKFVIEGASLERSSFSFSGKVSDFMGTVLLGLLLVVVTLGIYTPWYTRKITAFFVDRTALDEKNFKFKAKGLELFLIFVGYIIAAFFLGALSGVVTGGDFVAAQIVSQLLSLCIVPVYLYFIYRWYVNLEYNGYTIKWEAIAWNAILAIFIQILVSIITLGIYAPYATLKLYAYFANITVARKEGKVKRFAYEGVSLNTFGFIWGQIALTLITLGIYYPWAYVKVMKRIVSATCVYDETENEEIAA